MARLTVERCDKDSLTVAQLHGLGLLSGGTHQVTAGLRWPKLASMVAGPHGIHIRHRNGQEQSFRISWGRCLYSRRPWFVCQCGKRVGKLYNSWSGFACRWCQRLWYSSQACSSRKRHRLRIAKECSKIDGRPYLHISNITPPGRPAGFHRKRYHQLRGIIADLSLKYQGST